MIIKNLIAESLSKRIQALQDADKVFNSKNLKDAEELWVMINKFDIIKSIIIEKYHPEILKRSTTLFQYCIVHVQKQEILIDFLWSKCSSANIEDVECANGVIRSLSSHMNESVQY